MKAVICPVCQGTGTYNLYSSISQTCHGCNGKGWVEVREKGENDNVITSYQIGMDFGVDYA